MQLASVLAPAGGTSLLVKAGTTVSEKFSLTNGDKLDLSKILAGTSLAKDLTNIGNYVKVIGHGANDAGYGAGTQTVLQITGPGGKAIVHLEGSGNLKVSDLVNHNSLIPPAH